MSKNQKTARFIKTTRGTVAIQGEVGGAVYLRSDGGVTHYRRGRGTTRIFQDQ